MIDCCCANTSKGLPKKPLPCWSIAISTRFIRWPCARRATPIRPKKLPRRSLSSWRARRARCSNTPRFPAGCSKPHGSLPSPFCAVKFATPRRHQEAQMQTSLQPIRSGCLETNRPVAGQRHCRPGRQGPGSHCAALFRRQKHERGRAGAGCQRRGRQNVSTAPWRSSGSFSSRRGIASTTAVIAMVVSAQAVQAAPHGLVVTVCAAAVKGAAAGGSTLALVKGH